MLYKKINDMNISALVLGTDYYGYEREEKDCFYMLDKYVEFGGNCIDTANIYADGNSERLIGKWLRNVARGSVYISTKGGHPTGDKSISRLSERDIEEDLNISLERLGTDYIDLYWLHRDDIKKPVSEIIEALNKFIKQGKIRNIGASNWTVKRINEANGYAEKMGLKPFCASQIKWSLAVTNPEYEDDVTLVEMDGDEYAGYTKNGISVFAYASQGKGFFSKYACGEKFLSEKARERYLCETNVRRFELIKKLADEKNISVSQAVVSYIYSNRDINSFAIVGPRNKEQLNDCLGNTDILLTDEEIKRLSSIK